MRSCDISVVIPTYNRPCQLLGVITKILACVPRPDEIIVHIDGGDDVSEQAIRESQFQNVFILKGLTQLGPGGGRNRAISCAKNTIVASFDDDSYPIDTDYFERLQVLFDRFPEAAVIGAAVFHINEVVTVDTDTAIWVADFTGCGCAYRRNVFLQTNGYISLPVAYGMEEVDLTLQLHSMGFKILRSSWLRVFHDTRLEHHKNPKITAASIANLALLTYLRYPIKLWWFGLGQCLNRVVWLIRHNRITGIVPGILTIPGLIWRNRSQRQTISAQSLRSYFYLRSNPTSADRQLEAP